MTDLKDRGGFTLLEVLLAIVLVGTAWAVFAFNVNTVLDKDPLAELESSFTMAQTDGRMLAFENRNNIELSWDEKANRFVLLRNSVIASYEIDGLEDLDEEIELNATFYFQEPIYKGESFSNPEWFEVESIMLYPDASSALFKVILEEGDRKREIVVEPFTGFFSERSE